VICNERLHGQLNRYKEAMVNKYGARKVAKWEIEGKKVIHNRDMDFEGRAEEYKKRTNIMLKPFGYSSYDQMLKN